MKLSRLKRRHLWLVLVIDCLVLLWAWPYAALGAGFLPSTTRLNGPTQGTAYGEMQFTVTVEWDSSTTSHRPTGQVRIMEEGKVLGTAAIPTDGGSYSADISIYLSGGTHTIRGEYLGDENFAASASASSDITINRATISRLDIETSYGGSNYSCPPTPTYQQTCEIPTSRAGSPVTIYVTYDNNYAKPPEEFSPTGYITIMDNGRAIGQAPFIDWKAEFTTSSLEEGYHVLSGHYEGDASYEPKKSGAASHRVVSATQPEQGTGGGVSSPRSSSKSTQKAAGTSASQPSTTQSQPNATKATSGTETPTTAYEPSIAPTLTAGAKTPVSSRSPAVIVLSMLLWIVGFSALILRAVVQRRHRASTDQLSP